MENVIINDIFKTTYDNQTCWVSYSVSDKVGYEIINKRNQDNIERLQLLCNTNKRLNGKYTIKNYLSVCSNYLQEIINECLHSENEMYFVEYEDLDEVVSSSERDSFINNLKLEAAYLDIQDYVRFNEDGCAITVYGGLITLFLF